MVTIGINGFGRIGRLVVRALYEYGIKDIQLKAINTRSNTDSSAHLLKYDSAHQIFQADIQTKNDVMMINGDPIQMSHEANPENIDWAGMGVDIVMECSGKFRTKTEASLHFKGGAKKVILSAPGTDVDATIVVGVNDHVLQADHKVISCASCTTNCLAPLAKILEEELGIAYGFMTTIHAYTGDQNLVDSSHKDLRRARAAAQNIIPTSTGAAQAVALVLPALEGKLDGTSLRVPTQNVSLVDLTFTAKTKISADGVNAMMKAASVGALKNIIAYCDTPLVSSDFNHHPASAIFDASGTKVMGENLVRIMAWYDNEWGFSNRMIDLARLAA